jgi:branched-chain amino acid transport system permease protein
MIFSVPVTFGANWLVYRFLMMPLVRRARNREQLEGESILATFGLLFILRGAATFTFSANDRFYDYLGQPVSIFGFTFAANRVLAFAMACVFAAAIWIVLNRTRFGSALRALAIDPVGAELVGIDVRGLSALAFAAGGGLVAAAGTLVSTFLSFNPSIGIDFTVKALVVVIMGGIGNVGGSLIAGLLLGVAEALCSYYVDSGLTLAVAYALFLIVLVVRPRGLFGTP